MIGFGARIAIAVDTEGDWVPRYVAVVRLCEAGSDSSIQTRAVQI